MSRPWAYFDSVFDSTSSNWRTWYSAHFHGLYNDAQKDEVRDVLAHLKTREEDVWVGTFTQVVEYDGASYALVDAIPDRGGVVVSF